MLKDLDIFQNPTKRKSNKSFKEVKSDLIRILEIYEDIFTRVCFAMVLNSEHEIVISEIYPVVEKDNEEESIWE